MQASNRGKAFGALYLTGSLGGMFGSLYATNLGKTLVSYSMLNATTLACHCICQLSVLGQNTAEPLQSDDTIRCEKNCTRDCCVACFTTALGSETSASLQV